MYHSDDIRTKAIYTYIHPTSKRGQCVDCNVVGVGDGSYKVTSTLSIFRSWMNLMPSDDVRSLFASTRWY